MHRTARNEGSKVWGHTLCGNLSATLRRTRPSCASCGFCVECGRRHIYVNLQTAQALRWSNCPGQHVARQALRALFLLTSFEHSHDPQLDLEARKPQVEPNRSRAEMSRRRLPSFGHCAQVLTTIGFRIVCEQ
jgi:hypothetical protein